MSWELRSETARILAKEAHHLQIVASNQAFTVIKMRPGDFGGHGGCTQWQLQRKAWQLEGLEQRTSYLGHFL